MMKWPWTKDRELPPVDTSEIDEIKEEHSKQRVETERVVRKREHYKRTNHYVEDWMTAWRGQRRGS